MRKSEEIQASSRNVCRKTVSKPLHLQRVELLTDLRAFETVRRHELLPVCSSDEDSDQIIVDDHSPSPNHSDMLADVCDGKYFNQEFTDLERIWLGDICQEDVPHAILDNNDHISGMLKRHLTHKKAQRKTTKNRKKVEENQYYGSGLVANYDKYPEHKKAIQAKYPKKKAEELKHRHIHHDVQSDVLLEGLIDPHHRSVHTAGGSGAGTSTSTGAAVGSMMSAVAQQAAALAATTATGRKHKSKKFKDEEAKRKYEEALTAKRRRVLTSIYKKEIGKQQRIKVNRHKEALISVKKMALQCQKAIRQKAIQSQRVCKELMWRMKRLSRENQAYWRRSKRLDREKRRKQEKEAEEQRKMDHELTEVKRQQRKLNFLITQTELYAHFMSKKLKEGATEQQQLNILKQLEENDSSGRHPHDDYNSDVMKAKAIKNAQEAFHNERARTRQFNSQSTGRISARVPLPPVAAILTPATITSAVPITDSLDTVDGELVQPQIFQGTLKAYQLRGMNWLANLYDQGISGILADEMGLGKTVQSIAFLSHLAEFQDLWGPFLIICPASTLHNWQQEFERFVPEFKVVPYWGNPSDRKILRQFWYQEGMHTKNSSYHVVITSYQIVISDVKYFNRIKWQYMVLDEAQAIKSTSSMRWKTLLGFNCRNRLLLSGTPIQNSMAELWALLHFIMPTLFDSHEEFNEWFSKDIESHAENKTGIDEKHLSRLHMILKPFMLRRIKKDVENELSDKIEVMVYCPLTTRQRLLYMALKQKIRIEDLLHYTVGGGDSHSVDKNFTSNLMNLVMQFRKVCNHPELFERRDAKSPIYMSPCIYAVPRLIYEYNPRMRKQTFISKYLQFSALCIAQSLFTENDPYSLFNFLGALKMSPAELYGILIGDINIRWKSFYEICTRSYQQYFRNEISSIPSHLDSLFFWPYLRLSMGHLDSSAALKDLIFTSSNTGGNVTYTFMDHQYHAMAETIEHKDMRMRKRDDSKLLDKLQVNLEMPEVKRKEKVIVRPCLRTEMPSFLFFSAPRTVTQPPVIYCQSRRAAYHWCSHIDDYSWRSLHMHWLRAIHPDRITTVGHYSRIMHGRLLPPLEVVAKTGDGVRGAYAHATVTPMHGWSNVTIPDKESLVNDSGKLSVLDGLLRRLKVGGHRVLIYSQMTKMIDLLEEYMCHRQHKYMRLDGSSKISERRDMVADFQTHSDYFVFLLSTRAGGLGINLTAADTVIFYDSDWNPTVDQQAMDRAHRLGQTKQVTVYRLICKGSIEERILQRAREKSEIQKLVISGGNFKPDTLKPKEVVSLLLDDEEIELKYRQRTEERKHVEDLREHDRKRKYSAAFKPTAAATATASVEVPIADGTITVVSAPAATTPSAKRIKKDSESGGFEEQWLSVDSTPNSPHSEHSPEQITSADDMTDGSILDVEGDIATGLLYNNRMSSFNIYSNSSMKIRNPGRGSSKRGRPRGSKRMSALGRFNAHNVTTTDGHHASDVVTHPPLKAVPPPAYSPFDMFTNAVLNTYSNTPSNVGARSNATLAIPATMTLSAAAGLTGDHYTVGAVPCQQSSTAAAALDSYVHLSGGGIFTGGTGTSPSAGQRRGPGRPRLKPCGPLNTGGRGTYRPRRPARPLPVPLPCDNTAVASQAAVVNAAGPVTTAGTTVGAYSTYLFGIPENSD